MSLRFWLFAGGFGLIGAWTNNLQLLLLAGLAIIAFRKDNEEKGLAVKP